MTIASEIIDGLEQFSHALKDGNVEETHRVTVVERIDTGLRDSDGANIYIGSKLRSKVTCNTEMHGEWAYYDVVQRGIIPVMRYTHSERGEVLPVGYLSCCLSDMYDGKMLMFAKNIGDLRPCRS